MISVDLLGRDEFSASKCRLRQIRDFKTAALWGPGRDVSVYLSDSPRNSNQGGNPDYLAPGFLTAGRKSGLC